MALVEVEVTGGVAVVTLNDPERRNVLTGPMVESIVAAFDALEADPTVAAAVVTGAAPAFCAGADLGDLGASRDAGIRSIYEGFLRVARSPLPTIAAVNGAAVGAGMNLALGCDVRVVAESAKFICRFVELGLHPGGGHTWMLQRAVGAERAAAMVLFGETVRGPEAERMGLALRAVPDAEVVDAALTLASGAATAPPELVRRVKATMRAVRPLADHDAAVDTELDAQVWSLGQPFFAERLAAMQARVQKR